MLVATGSLPRIPMIPHISGYPLVRRPPKPVTSPSLSGIPGSPHNPKFLWVDDAEIVGDRITEVRPVPGNFFTQKTERRISELGACCVAFVVRDVSVHEAPQPLDRIQMRAIGRNEMQ